jgi:hypothetical protein
VSWTASPGAAHYVIWWRDTTSPVWQHSYLVDGAEIMVTLKGVVIDDWFFGVQAVSTEGYESRSVCRRSGRLPAALTQVVDNAATGYLRISRLASVRSSRG